VNRLRARDTVSRPATQPVSNPVIRRADFSLSDEQRALRDAFAKLLARECPSERVRESEPLGFDAKLWRLLLDVRVIGMGMPSEAGGDGGGLIELALVAEQIGRLLAPVPFIESVVAARLLARCGLSASPWLHSAAEGEAVITCALHPASLGRVQLVPAGAVADAVLALVGDQLVVAHADHPPPLVPNHGRAPLGLWELTSADLSRDVLLGGDAARRAFGQAVREWKLLMAAAQIGVAEGALALACDFARERVAFGAPIATYQGIAHPLVDCHIAIIGARRLVWKAAWFADYEPEAERQLIPMAFAQACRTGTKATTVGVHTQGGLGFTVDSDMQLYFRRAKGWANVVGDPAHELSLIADELYA
jgi:alkylation response protein AidB-like acyl-CoA dehydrogenase